MRCVWWCHSSWLLGGLGCKNLLFHDGRSVQAFNASHANLFKLCLIKLFNKLFISF
ncbi:hypothetical protein GLYMA_05G080166v4 [Glycine max]|nr:hypothetical protein GLYMA_05G080166v4 [Glycine max]KAH1133330.1 hypothetical protein GYH30_011955 [Glycine max]